MEQRAIFLSSKIMDRDAAIKEFVNSLAPGWCAMDFRTFADTIDIFLYDPLIAEPWTKSHTIPMIAAVAHKQLGFREIARLLHDNPSAIRCLLAYDLLMAKYARCGAETYLSIFDFYYQVLQSLVVEDIFVLRGHNRIHDATAAQKLLKNCAPASLTIAKALGKLTTACYQLSYGLYSDMNPQLVYDNFGPYFDADKKLFVIKIFHNLKPVELWPETGTLPVEQIDIGALYEGVTLTVDAATHGIYTGDQINGLRGYWCTANGKNIDLTAVRKLSDEIGTMAIKIYRQVKQFDFEKKKEFYWFQKAWGYKQLFDRLGLPWKPATAVLEAARGKPIFNKWNIPKDRDKAIEALKNIFDPRIEIPDMILK